MAAMATVVSALQAPARQQPAQQHRARCPLAQPAAQRPLARRARVAVAASAGQNGSADSSPVIGAPQQQHVIRMVNLVTAYFDTLLTQGDRSVMHEILEPTISHKDMVRNIGRIGMAEYEAYLIDLHQRYPDYYVRPTHFGFADNRMMFVSFEGAIDARAPKFAGVDLFLFNDDASRIKEVQVYRSSWLGAQGHDERKKLADAAARTKEAAARRGVMP